MVLSDRFQSFEILAPYFAWIREENFPTVVAVYRQLDIPFWDDYTEAFHQWSDDFLQSSRSSWKFLDLTFRPFVQLLLIILSGLFEILLKQGLVSLKKGSVQAKSAAVWFYHFQRSLTREQVLGEVAIVCCCVALYYFRKWLKRQTYWTRASKWASIRKKKLAKSYANAVKRLSEVSLGLAMTLPHIIFLGGAVAFKVLLPDVLEWVIRDTHTTAAVCLWYPFVSTLILVHSQRLQQKDESNKSATKDSKKSTLLAKSGGKLAGKGTDNGGSKGVVNAASTNKPRSKNTSKDSSHTDSAATAEFWLQYWVTYSIVQAFGQVCHLVPLFGRIVAKHPFFQNLSAEFNLFFFVWIFTMDLLMRVNVENSFLAPALPLTLTKRFLNPIILDLDAVVSQAIPAGKWKSVVISKVQKMLDAFVLVRFLSEGRKEWLVHILEESRVLLIPSITLLMPSFATQFGVAYVQYLVPSAKSAHAHQNNTQFLFLQYWLLHCIFVGFLAWFARILWWIPFSTHAIFIAWCNLSFPKTIDRYYALLEFELVTFGALPGSSTASINDTNTAKLVRAIANRLYGVMDDSTIQSTTSADGKNAPDDSLTSTRIKEPKSDTSTASLSSAREKDAKTASSPLP